MRTVGLRWVTSYCSRTRMQGTVGLCCQLHLDIQQQEGILSPWLNFIWPWRQVTGSDKPIIHPVTKHNVTLTLEKTHRRSHVVDFNVVNDLLVFWHMKHLFCFFVRETHHEVCPCLFLHVNPSFLFYIFFPLLLGFSLWLCLTLVWLFFFHMSRSFCCQLPASFSHNIT